MIELTTLLHKFQVKNTYTMRFTQCPMSYVSCSVLALLILMFSTILTLAQEKKFLIIGIDGLMPEEEELPEMSNIISLYRDENGDVIDSGVRETVSREDREGDTVLIYRETRGFVSPGTRSALIELHAIGVSENEEGIKALADQLSFKLILNDR